MLDRSVSTISREIHRNIDKYGYLYAGDAHKRAQEKRNKNMPKIIKNKNRNSKIPVFMRKLLRIF